MNEVTVLGRSSKGFPFRKIIEVADKERFSHTLVLGMTGSGKTTTLFNMLAQDYVKRSVLVVDGKGDISILGGLKEEFQHLIFGERVQGNCYYNPLIGPVDQVVNNFFEATFDQFESVYYRGFAESLLKGYLILCQNRDEEFQVPVLSELQKLCVSIEEFSDEIGEKFHIDEIKTAFGTLLEMKPEQYRLVHSGLYNIIHNLVQSSWAECLEGKGAFQDLPLFDLEKLHNSKRYFYVGLQKLANTQGTKIIGRLILAKLANIVALRATIDPFDLGEYPEVSCVVDEVAGLAFPVLSNLVQVARSSRIMMTLSTQTLGDLDNVSTEFTQQIESNTGVKIVHQLNSAGDTDRMAKYFGTEEIKKSKVLDRVLELFQKKNTSVEAKKEATIFRVSPDSLKELATGVAVISSRSKYGKSKNITETKIFNFREEINSQAKVKEKDEEVLDDRTE